MSRGLLFRSKGDTFKDSEGKILTFQLVEYFPSSGEYSTIDDLSNAIKHLTTIAVNGISAFTRACAVITFINDEGENVRYLKYFNKITPFMSGKWANSELPGGYRLQRPSSLKGTEFGPASVLKGSSFNNMYDLLNLSLIHI